MALFVLYALGCIALLFGLVPFLMSRRFKGYVETKLKEPPPFYTPRVSVIIPCKGVDLQFEENIAAMLSQDYPDYEVIFVTATEDDPAYGKLEGITADHTGKNARLLVAGKNPHRGQKLTNLLKAIENVSPETEVFVFLDADIRIHPQFVRYLVAPLRDDRTGAATGFPLYLPQSGKLGSILRSIWGMGGLLTLVDERRNFASGAANASRRVTFEKAGVARAMDRSISDTFAITNSVRKLGLRIEFVPQCLVISPDDSTLAETFRWTNRQTVISRVYSPPFWWMVTLSYSFSSLMLVLGGGLLAGALVTGKAALLVPGLMMLGLIPLSILNAALSFPVMEKLVPDCRDDLRRLRWKYLLATPLATILITLNSIVSLTTNEISWRGVRYRLVSPGETVVLSEE